MNLYGRADKRVHWTEFDAENESNFSQWWKSEISTVRVCFERKMENLNLVNMS